MKKYLLSTLFVSSLLASCTNEELLVTPNGEEGEKIEVKLSATYPDLFNEANTRMELVGNDWAWVNGDMLGACKVAAVDAAAANLISSNYPFFLTKELTNPTKNVDFKTNTAVFAGKYVFYHQYNGDLIGGATSANDNFAVDFSKAQVIDPLKPTEHLTKQNIWVSPVITLGGIKYNAKNETAIKLVGLNAVLKLAVTNNSSDGALAINRVEVNGVGFPVSGNLDFAEATKFPVLNPTDADYATKLNEAAGDNGTMQAADMNLLASSATVNGTKISAVVVGTGISVPKGETVNVYVLVPAGEYGIGSTQGTKAIQTITFLTSKGQFKINAQDARKGAGKGQEVASVAFDRNSLKQLYPELTGSASPIAKYDINGMNDWDNAVAYALANINSNIEFNLMANLEIKKLPSCPLYVTSTTDKKLTLAAGGTYDLNKNSYFCSIENLGTLNVTGNSYVGTLINKGTINVATTEVVKGVATTNYTAWTSATNGISTLTNQGTINLNGKMNAAAGTWTNTKADVTAGTTLGTININEKADLAINAATTNAGKIVVKGSITLGAILTNAGTIDVKTATGQISAKTNLTSKTITNTGEIALDAPVDVFMLNGAATTTTFITSSGSTGLVEVAIASKEVTPSLPAIEEINSVKMSGAWAQTSLSVMTTKWAGITSQTWDAVTLDASGLNTELNKVAKLVINSTSAINSTAAVSFNFASTSAAAAITVNGDLTIAQNVTIGASAANSPEITVLGSITNNGTIYTALTVGAAAVATAPANTTAKFTNNETGKVGVASVFSSSSYTSAELALYGTFINKAPKANVQLKTVDFKIQGESTYTGEYTTEAASFSAF